MKITKLNIEDIIRTEKKRLLYNDKNPQDYAFYWGDEGWLLLEEYFRYVCNFKGFAEKMDFMGVRHFWDKGKSGYKFLKNKK